MRRRGVAEQTEREQRLAAIDGCLRCDETGWLLGADRTPIEPARRCTHNPPPVVRDITEPIHQPDLLATQELEP